MYSAFRPGKFWYDTNGKPIHAHGGSLLFVDGKYYWYGENKDGVTGRATGNMCPIWHNGVRLYSSNDLYNWTDEGVILVERNDKDAPFYPGRIMDRPHILYNQATKKFVLWAKIGGLVDDPESFGHCYFAVYESDDIHGEWLQVNIIRDYPAGDFDFYEIDGKTYIIFEKPHTEMLCGELNENYTAFTGKISSHLPYPFPPYVREAPAHFERKGKHYMLTSGTTGYFPNPTELVEIPTAHGEWKEWGNACVGDKKENSFHAQFSSVFKHPFKKDLYIALGDRWLTDLSENMPDPRAMFEGIFNKEKKSVQYDMSKYTDENTSQATYVWLPIRFDEKGAPYLCWEDEWRIEDFE